MESKKDIVLYHPTYRADIDGLRGIAVLSVVFFHAFPNWVNAGYFGKGAFIGVDIFFVISGYLISSIILKSLSKDSFSFVQFYWKRVNRIFPALIFVLSFCLIFGWFVLLPHEYKQFGKHVLGAVTYTNNFMYWKESGYFDNESVTKPLLHLWSLSIEEQFYIFWPFLLWAGYKKKLNLLTLTILILLLSFFLHLHKIHLDKIAAFYATHLRVWELLVGSLVAYLQIKNFNFLSSLAKKVDSVLSSILFTERGFCKDKLLGNFQSFLGFILIVIGVGLVDKNRLFPGWWAMGFPVLGAALLISAPNYSWLNRKVLSNKILVWFGLISYPLYLWHWPLLSFSAIIDAGSSSRNTRFLIVILSILLAWITYRFVERPLRYGASIRAKNIIMLIIMVVIGVVGLAIEKKYIGPQSKSLALTKYLDFSGYPQPIGEHVDAERRLGMLGVNVNNKIYLIGDSHAEQYRNTFAQIYIRNHSLEDSAPSLIYNLDYVDVAGLVKLSNDALKDSAVTTVVFSKFWALTYGSDKINYAVRCCGTGQGGSVGGEAHHASLSVKQMDMFDSQIEQVATSLIKNGKRVYFVLDNPFGTEISPRGIFKRSLLHGINLNDVKLSREEAIKRVEPSRSRIIEIANKTGAKIIDPFQYLCDSSYCAATDSYL